MGGRGASSSTERFPGNGNSILVNGHDGTPKSLYEGYKPEIARFLGVADEDKAYEIARGLVPYTGGKFDYILAWQRGELDTSIFDDEIELANIVKAASDIENYISYAPKWGTTNGTTYRGLTRLTDEELGAITTVGSVITSRGNTTSWTTRLGLAEGYANYDGDNNGVVLISDSQKLGTSIRYASRYQYEEEVVVSKSARYVVENVYNKDGITYVKVKEL